jgi:hypothetical protein
MTTGRPGPKWAHWKNNDAFLPGSFHKEGGMQPVLNWLCTTALKSADNLQPAYDRMELVILTIGLALRDIYRAADHEQFPQLEDSKRVQEDADKLLYICKAISKNHLYVTSQVCCLPDNHIVDL